MMDPSRLVDLLGASRGAELAALHARYSHLLPALPVHLKARLIKSLIGGSYHQTTASASSSSASTAASVSIVFSESSLSGSGNSSAAASLSVADTNSRAISSPAPTKGLRSGSSLSSPLSPSSGGAAAAAAAGVTIEIAIISNLLLSTPGAALTVLKNLLDAADSGHDLLHVYRCLPPALQRHLLKHIDAQAAIALKEWNRPSTAAAAGAQDQSNGSSDRSDDACLCGNGNHNDDRPLWRPVKIYCDWDDSVQVRLFDHSFPTGTVYPGVKHLLRELQRGGLDKDRMVDTDSTAAAGSADGGRLSAEANATSGANTPLPATSPSVVSSVKRRSSAFGLPGSTLSADALSAANIFVEEPPSESAVSNSASVSSAPALSHLASVSSSAPLFPARAAHGPGRLMRKGASICVDGGGIVASASSLPLADSALPSPSNDKEDNSDSENSTSIEATIGQQSDSATDDIGVAAIAAANTAAATNVESLVDALLQTSIDPSGLTTVSSELVSLPLEAFVGGELAVESRSDAASVSAEEVLVAAAVNADTPSGQPLTAAAISFSSSTAAVGRGSPVRRQVHSSSSSLAGPGTPSQPMFGTGASSGTEIIPLMPDTDASDLSTADDSFLLRGRRPSGDVILLSARPELLRSSTLKLAASVGIAPSSVLLGTLSAALSNSRMAGRKLSNYSAYQALFPEYRVVLVGDSGQGDVTFGLAALEAHAAQYGLTSAAAATSASHGYSASSGVRGVPSGSSAFGATKSRCACIGGDGSGISNDTALSNTDISLSGISSSNSSSSATKSSAGGEESASQFVAPAAAGPSTEENKAAPASIDESLQSAAAPDGSSAAVEVAVRSLAADFASTSSFASSGAVSETTASASTANLSSVIAVSSSSTSSSASHGYRGSIGRGPLSPSSARHLALAAASISCDGPLPAVDPVSSSASLASFHPYPPPPPPLVLVHDVRRADQSPATSQLDR